MLQFAGKGSERRAETQPMQGSLEQPPIIIRSARWKSLLRAAGSLGFVALGGWLVLDERQYVIGALAAAFFGITLMIAAWETLSPNVLEITPEGIRYSKLWRRVRLSWRDITEFAVVKVRSSSFVGLNYSPGYVPRKRRFDMGLTGMDDTLPVGWSVDPGTLCDLLNRARSRWAGAGSTSLAEHTIKSSYAVNRMGRRTYWIIVGLLVAVSIAIGMTVQEGKYPAGALGVLWIWPTVRRLHDFGRTGWLIAAVIGLQVVVVVGAIVGGADVDLTISAATLVQLVFTVWVGVMPGDRGINRFGPPPGRRPTAMPAAVFE